jgi:spermidine synthase
MTVVVPEISVGAEHATLPEQLAGRGDFAPPDRLPDGLRFLTTAGIPPLFDFPPDMRPVPAEANHLDDQVLVRYYEAEWEKINR